MRPIKRRNQLSSTSTMSEHIPHSNLVGSKAHGFARLHLVGSNNRLNEAKLKVKLVFLI